MNKLESPGPGDDPC